MLGEVPVCVQWMSGKILKFRMPTTATIEDVKAVLESGDDGVPVDFQTLLCGECEVHDQDSLEHWSDWEGNAKLVKLTLLLSSSRSLGANAGKTRKLATLRELTGQHRGTTFVKYAMPQVAMCLEDVVDEVREGAVQALTALAAVSRDQALEEVRPRLVHNDWSVRRHAVKALQQISLPDDLQSIVALKTMMQDPNIRVRVAVVLALMSLLKTEADTCDDDTLRELRASLQDSHLLAKHVAAGAGCKASSSVRA